MFSIITINDSCDIYKSQVTDDGLITLDLVHSFTKEKMGGLNLSDNFAMIFQELFKDFKEGDEVFYFIGDRAGFMDSRIVFIWLSNLELFVGAKYWVTRRYININNTDSIKELVDEVRADGIKDLAYAREPNIGVK